VRHGEIASSPQASTKATINNMYTKSGKTLELEQGTESNGDLLLIFS
jgi:hypothetical protein